MEGQVWQVEEVIKKGKAKIEQSHPYSFSQLFSMFTSISFAIWVSFSSTKSEVILDVILDHIPSCDLPVPWVQAIQPWSHRISPWWVLPPQDAPRQASVPRCQGLQAKERKRETKWRYWNLILQKNKEKVKARIRGNQINEQQPTTWWVHQIQVCSKKMSE